MGLSSFDKWLTTDPHGEIDTAFERFCEERDLDPSSDEALAAWDTYTEEQAP